MTCVLHMGQTFADFQSYGRIPVLANLKKKNIGPKACDNSLKGSNLISSGPAVFERFLFLQQLLPSLLIGVAVYGRTYIYMQSVPITTKLGVQY